MGKTSLSERTLEGFAASYSAFFSDENAVTEEGLKAILANVKSIEGQYSHDLSSGLEEAKKKLVPPAIPTPPPPQETPEDKELKERLERLDKLYNDLQKEREAAAARQAREALAKEIENGLVAKGCQKGIFLDFVLTQIDGSKDAAANIASLKEVYDKKMTDSIQSGAFIPQTVPASAASVTEEQQKQMMEQAIQGLKERHQI